MPYTRPAYNSADATWDGAQAYARPAYTFVYGTWSEDDAEVRIADSGLPLAPAVLLSVPFQFRVADSGLPLAPALRIVRDTVAYISDTGLPAVPAILFASPRITIDDDGGLPLAPRVLLRHGPFAFIADSGLPLAPAVYAYAMFPEAAIDEFAPFKFVVDLITATGIVRVQSSSAQATLQTDSECYGSVVIPNCGDLLDTLDVTLEFVVKRVGRYLDGTEFEVEIFRCPMETIQTDRGPVNYTASLSGYFDTFPTIDDPDARYDRLLKDIRSISVYESGLRLRAAVDWTLRPSQRAYYGETSFVVSYINYYLANNDAYMDVGERLPAA